jgi:predicted phosphodiesterase
VSCVALYEVCSIVLVGHFWILWLIFGAIVYVSALWDILIMLGTFLTERKYWIMWALAVPLILLILYPLSKMSPWAHGNDRDFFPFLMPFSGFPLPLSRYPPFLETAFVAVSLNAILFRARFHRMLFRFGLLVTEPLLVMITVLLLSSFYLQYYVLQMLHFRSAFHPFAVWDLPDLKTMLAFVLLAITGLGVCFFAMRHLVVRPLWRALRVIYAVAHPYLALEVFRSRRYSRLLEFDRNCSDPDLLIVSDLHISRHGTLDSGLSADSMLLWLTDLVSTAKPRTVVLCGHVTDVSDDESWEVAARVIRSLGIPTVVIPGNHDVHFKRLSADRPDSWARYFVEFFMMYFYSSGEGVGSFSSEDVLTKLRTVSSFDIDEFPHLVSLVDLPVDILLLDSNRRGSSSAITNAIGYVGRDQLAKARRLVSRRRTSALLIALHHHVIPVLALETALLTCSDASEVVRFALEVGASAILHGHTHMPNIVRYSRGKETTLILSCGSALFPARGQLAKEIRFPSCLGLRLKGNAIDDRVGLFVRKNLTAKY